MTEPDVAEAVDERALVARAQNGDVHAFESLYHALSPRVFGLCLHMSGDRVRATELLQDVFVRVWVKLSSYRGEAEFASWVHRLAVNTVLEENRKDARRAARVRIGETYPEPAGREDRADYRMDLEQAMTRLTPALRRVFVLHDVEGYRHSEIAKMTGLAEGTLRAQLHHARKVLMEVLER